MVGTAKEIPALQQLCRNAIHSGASGGVRVREFAAKDATWLK